MSVTLTKPVSLVKRPRAGEGWTSRHLNLSRIDYVKRAGKHVAEYRWENERFNNAMCTANHYSGAHYGDSHVEADNCPACRPEQYVPVHAYQIDMF